MLIISTMLKYVKELFNMPLQIPTAKCGECNEIKYLTEFYLFKNKRNKRCKDCIRAYQVHYNSSNKEAIQAYRKSHYQVNRIKMINKVLAHAKKNPEIYRIRAMARHAARLQRTPKWLTLKQLDTIKNFYIKANYLTKKYKRKYEVDHIVPLQGKNVSGLHVPWNLRIATKSENCSKSNKYPLKVA